MFPHSLPVGSQAAMTFELLSISVALTNNDTKSRSLLIHFYIEEGKKKNPIMETLKQIERVSGCQPHWENSWPLDKTAK